MRLSRIAGMARLLLFSFALVAGHGARAETLPTQLDGDNVAKIIDPLMEEWIARKGAGAVVVVVRRDGPIFAKGYGYADAEAKTSFTADATLVRPGSISKLFTGVAVMQLVDQGKLDLDRDVSDYIDFAIPTPPGGVPVTLRRLLTHRAGFEEHAKNLFSKSSEPTPLGTWLEKSWPPRLFPNGDVPAYSNYGVTLAGYIVERVSGEPFPDYAARHILEPLGMRRSTFRQPLPGDLAPSMAKGYRAPGQPPLTFFETIAATPAGALSATGEDMGRFMRALLNGGELDGVRILSRERLAEMTAPRDETPAGYLGLVFFGQRIGGHPAVGHGGGTLAFLSDLELFLEPGVGVFVSRDGSSDMKKPPDPARAIAEHFLPRAPEAATSESAGSPADGRLSGVYQASRRAESSFMRIAALLSERVVAVDAEGRLRFSSAIWPFGESETLRRIGENLYEGPRGGRLASVSGDGSDPYFATPAIFLQRAPWFVDARWIAPAFAASAALGLATLLGWPVAALWRRWRKRPWSADVDDRRRHLAVRLVLLVDAAAIAAAAFIFFRASDFSILNDALDPWLLALYALAWVGVLGAAAVVWIALSFWLRGVGGRWTRFHHGALAASALMIAFVFVTFHIAGTTLNY